MKSFIRNTILSVLILCLSWFATAAQAYTITTNYSFQLPQVNNAVDQDQWGTELNANWSSIDALLKTATNATTTALTGNTTLSASNQNNTVLANATGGAFTVTLLPSATAGSGFKLTIKKTDSSANTVTVQGNASELIDLSNTLSLASQNQSVTLVSDGTQWWIVGQAPLGMGTGTVSVSSNSGTCLTSFSVNNFTNSSAATMAITLSTSGAVDGQKMIVRIYDYSGVAETIGWTNTENSIVSVPTTSNGSTTLPLSVGFMFNGVTSKWRCLASS